MIYSIQLKRTQIAAPVQSRFSKANEASIASERQPKRVATKKRASNVACPNYRHLTQLAQSELVSI